MSLYENQTDRADRWNCLFESLLLSFLLPENKLGGITHEQIKEFFATNQCKRYQA